MPEQVVFLDRDGVINQKAPPHDYIRSWKQFRFLPHAVSGLRRLTAGGYRLVVVTNQRGIARGLMSEKDVETIHKNMCRELWAAEARIDGIFVCPHEEGTCTCRKPEIGLFQQAEKQFAVDKQKSYMIGDGGTDIMAGKRFGVHTIAIGPEPENPEFRCSNLDEAADYILGIHKSNL